MVEAPQLRRTLINRKSLKASRTLKFAWSSAGFTLTGKGYMMFYIVVASSLWLMLHLTSAMPLLS